MLPFLRRFTRPQNLTQETQIWGQTHGIAPDFDDGAAFGVDELGEVGGQLLRTVQTFLQDGDHFRERVALVVDENGAESAELEQQDGRSLRDSKPGQVIYIRSLFKQFKNLTISTASALSVK